MKRITDVYLVSYIETNPDLSFIEEDSDRMEAYFRGDWCMLGIQAIAKIQTSENGKSWLCNEVASGGLWGIESDSDDSYKKELFNEQLEELRNVLETLGFNKRQIDQAFKAAVEKDGGYV